MKRRPQAKRKARLPMRKLIGRSGSQDVLPGRGSMGPTAAGMFTVLDRKSLIDIGLVEHQVRMFAILAGAVACGRGFRLGMLLDVLLVRASSANALTRSLTIRMLLSLFPPLARVTGRPRDRRIARVSTSLRRWRRSHRRWAGVCVCRPLRRVGGEPIPGVEAEAIRSSWCRFSSDAKSSNADQPGGGAESEVEARPAEWSARWSKRSRRSTVHLGLGCRPSVAAVEQPPAWAPDGPDRGELGRQAESCFPCRSSGADRRR